MLKLLRRLRPGEAHHALKKPLRVSALALLTLLSSAVFAADKPNILVIWGDDVGQSNISAYTMGLMGYQTPNIDRIANEGMIFTDYYGEQSCTAGRSSFIMGQSVFRTGLSKVGLPGADLGMQKEDPTIAGLLKNHGYATGQFGKNHLGDQDDMLPTNHGFDEFFGNLYHLNAEEEPENEDYPTDPAFRKKYGPRGVIRSSADGKIEDTGPLTKKRMEVVDDETAAAAMKFIEKAVEGRQALLRLVERHAHALPHPRGSRRRWRAAKSSTPCRRVHLRHDRARHAHRPVPRSSWMTWALPITPSCSTPPITARI